MNTTPRRRTPIWQELRNYPHFWLSLIFLGILILAACLGPQFSTYNPTLVDLRLTTAPPSLSHPLGCDLLGRDLLAGLIFGTKTTLYIACLTVAITTLIGTLIGLLSGYFYGLVDTCIMRFVDVILAFPGFLLNLALASLLGPSVNNIIIAISATGWASFARVVRGQVLSVREREYIQASRALGARHGRIVFRHILPALYSVIIITSTFALSSVILVEASISFLGLGAPDSAPTWGSILNQGRKVLLEAPLLSIAPGLLIMATVLAFNFIGDSLRDVLDPKH